MDSLQNCAMNSVFDEKGNLLKELFINISNRLMVIVVDSNDNENDNNNSVHWIGQSIEVPMFNIGGLFGHSLYDKSW